MPRYQIDCVQVESGTQFGIDQRHWLRAVVLTRSPVADQPTARFDTSGMFRVLEQITQRHGEAMSRGRVLLGGGGSSADIFPMYEASRSYDTLFVAGRTLLVPSTDSTLVVMVDRDAAGGSQVATATIRTDLPEDYWQKTWQNGDTTFIVRPRIPSSDAWLPEVLLAIPEVRAFVERPRSP